MENRINLSICLDEFLKCTSRHSISSDISIEETRTELLEKAGTYPMLCLLLNNALSGQVHRYDGFSSTINVARCIDEFAVCSTENNCLAPPLIDEFVLQMYRNRLRFPMIWAMMHYSSRLCTHRECVDAIGTGGL